MSSPRKKSFLRDRFSKLSCLPEKPRSGKKIGKSKRSLPRSPSHVIHGIGRRLKEPETATSSSHGGFKFTEKEIADMLALRDWCNTTDFIYFNPTVLRSYPGSKLLVPKAVPTCPHQGNENPFSFICCKPSCKLRAPVDKPSWCKFEATTSGGGQNCPLTAEVEDNKEKCAGRVWDMKRAPNALTFRMPESLLKHFA